MNARERELGFAAPVARSVLPTHLGLFAIYAFKIGDREHIALVMGNIEGKDAYVRLHSRCLTGDTFGSFRCECGPQLHAALKAIAKAKRGVLIYLDQEGRGIGIYNKIKAYALQDEGHDTVEANLHLGFGADERDFGDAARILEYLRVKSVCMMTNNPKKYEDLEKHGVRVHAVLPIKIRPNAFNRRYLLTKKTKMRHDL